MQAPFDNIVQHLFHQPSLQSVTVDELERMAQRHPYFAPAHFLLLKKMQDTAHPDFNAQLHKTTLYFHNPLWLQFLLQPTAVSGFTVADQSPFITETMPAVPGHPVDNNHTEQMAEPGQPITATSFLEVEENIANGLPVPEEIVQPAAAAGMMDIITEVFDKAETAQSVNAVQSAEPVQAAELAAVHDDTAPAAAHPVEPVTEGVDNEIAHAAVALPEHTIDEYIQNETEEDKLAEPAIFAAASMQEEAAVIGNDERDAGTAEADDTAAPPQAPLQPEIPLLKTIIETPAAQTDVLFEPYHTVDYFASQGIRLSKMENDAKDKLGRQLKSFTEWLKTMKKLPQVSIDKILSENEESKVVADAIHSIENKEVITEAMAEVFEKQGMSGKAVEVYQKLSLLNPAKSAYFAAKIEALKP